MDELATRRTGIIGIIGRDGPLLSADEDDTSPGTVAGRETYREEDRDGQSERGIAGYGILCVRQTRSPTSSLRHRYLSVIKMGPIPCPVPFAGRIRIHP